MNLLTYLPYFAGASSATGYGASWASSGVAAASQRRRSGAVLLVGAAVLAIVGVAEPAPSLFTTHQIGARILWATALGALILGAAMTPPRFLERGPLPFLGRISYSVYLLHPVVLLAFGAFGGATLLTSLGVGRTLTYALAAAICSAVVILLSWGTFRLIEAPGMAVGRRLVRRAREREVSRHLDDVAPDNESAESLAALRPGVSVEA